MTTQTMARTVQQMVPGAPRYPQVNLLPPEIRAGQQFRSTRPWLGVALLVTILVAGLMAVWSTQMVRTAEEELAEAEDQNQSLLSQQSEYAEVPQVLGELNDITEVRLYGMSPETLWRPYIGAIAATAPAGVSIETMTMTLVSGTQATTTVGPDVPSSQVVSQILFEARSVTLPDTAAWMDGLAAVPGLANPWFTAAEITNENEVVHYVVSGTVDVTYGSLALRFFGTEEED